MYRAYPVSLGQRGCHLPIYEVCNPEDDTLGDQIAVAKVRGTSHHTPKAFHVACIDSRAAVVAALFVCYDCHMRVRGAKVSVAWSILFGHRRLHMEAAVRDA